MKKRSQTNKENSQPCILWPIAIDPDPSNRIAVIVIFGVFVPPLVIYLSEFDLLYMFYLS